MLHRKFNSPMQVQIKKKKTKIENNEETKLNADFLLNEHEQWYCGL